MDFEKIANEFKVSADIVHQQKESEAKIAKLETIIKQLAAYANSLPGGNWKSAVGGAEEQQIVSKIIEGEEAGLGGVPVSDPERGE